MISPPLPLKGGEEMPTITLLSCVGICVGVTGGTRLAKLIERATDAELAYAANFERSR